MSRFWFVCLMNWRWWVGLPIWIALFPFAMASLAGIAIQAFGRAVVSVGYRMEFLDRLRGLGWLGRLMNKLADWADVHGRRKEWERNQRKGANW